MLQLTIRIPVKYIYDDVYKQSFSKSAFILHLEAILFFSALMLW